MASFLDYQLLVFTKAPVLGQAKTRMQPQLPAEFSLALHTQLVNYVLSNWSQANICPLTLYLAGESSLFAEVFPQWQSLPLRLQQGRELGERMYLAAKEQLEKNQAVILVGTDCPFIDGAYLNKACKALAEHDVVIGPASDGGYVLLAFKSCYKELFEGIAWGSESVFAETCKKIENLNLDYTLLPELDDIDRPEDLPELKPLSDFRGLLNQYSI